MTGSCIDVVAMLQATLVGWTLWLSVAGASAALGGWLVTLLGVSQGASDAALVAAGRGGGLLAWWCAMGHRMRPAQGLQIALDWLEQIGRGGCG